MWESERRLLAGVCFLCLVGSVFGERLLYDNSTGTGSYYVGPTADTEVLDFGTSSGGKVGRFVFGYATTAWNPASVTITFYRYTSEGYYPGSFVRSFTVSGLEGSSFGEAFYKEVTIPKDQQFELFNGEFGYSFAFQDGSTGPLLASGGSGNRNVFFEFDSWLDMWFSIWFEGNPWAGFYMQVYEAEDDPAADPNGCTISGYKFHDENANGNWDDGEETLSGWEFYIDLNENGQYDPAEPNALSDPNGLFEFEGVSAPGTYTLGEVQRDGWFQTYPGGLTYQIAAEPNNIYAGYHFGNTTALPVFTISGFARTYPHDEPLGGVTIEVFNEPHIATGIQAVTDENGYYELTLTGPWSGTLETTKEGWIQWNWSTVYRDIITDQTVNFDMKPDFCRARNTMQAMADLSVYLNGESVSYYSWSSYGYHESLASIIGLEKGSTYKITAGHSHNKSAVWVDWDNDFVFEESERTDLAYNNAHEHPFDNVTVWGAGDIGFVSVPHDAHEGLVTARIRAFEYPTDEVAPCGPVEGSATIDFTIDVRALGFQEPTYGGGLGTAESPCLIDTAEHLQMLGENPQHWSRHFRLTADIDMLQFTGDAFSIIGNYIQPFTGTFDGNDHIVSNFTYHSEEDSRIGIFGNVAAPAVIENLHLLDPDVVIDAGRAWEGGQAVGAIVGLLNEGATIGNCSVEGGLVAGIYAVAPIAGGSYGLIRQCRAYSTVTAHCAAAGLVGRMDRQAVTEDCFARGSVTADDMFPEAGNAKPVDMWIRAAGFVSDIGEATVRNCYARVDVTSSRNASGFADDVSSNGSVENCYSASTIYAVPGWALYKGYFTNSCSGASSSCYWDDDVIGDAPGSASTGCATGLSTQQMHEEASYAGWDFNSTWRICEGANYPRLQWEVPLPGDFVCPEGIELNDLLVLCEHWLSTDQPQYDIAPAWEPDGVINLLDFVVLAESWMSGTD